MPLQMVSMLLDDEDLATLFVYVFISNKNCVRKTKTLGSLSP